MSLLASDGKNPRFLARYTMMLFRQGLTDKARLSLAQLEKLEPRSLRTIGLKARLLAASGRASEVVPLLKSTGGANATQLGYVAGLLEELGQLAAAEELMRQFVSQSATPGRSGIGELLGASRSPSRGIGHLRTGLEIVSSRGRCRGHRQAPAYSGPIDDSQCQRAAKSLERELMKVSANAGLLFQLGNIRSLQGRYNESEALYRKSHRHDADNNGPLANLAWLLAGAMVTGPRPSSLLPRPYVSMGRHPTCSTREPLPTWRWVVATRLSTTWKTRSPPPGHL